MVRRCCWPVPLLVLAMVGCATARTCQTPDCVFVESRGLTRLNTFIWVPETTASFTLGVFDQTEDGPVGKPSVFSLRGPDGKEVRKLTAGQSQAWADYRIDAAGRPGAWQLSVAGPTPAEGQRAARNHFMVRTDGEVDLYLLPGAAPRYSSVTAPKFGGPTTHQFTVQVPALPSFRLVCTRPGTGDQNTVTLTAPAGVTATQEWSGMARGGTMSLVTRGPALAGLWTLNVATVTGTYGLGTANDLRLFCGAEPPLMPLPKLVTLTASTAGKPCAARYTLTSPQTATEGLTVYGNAFGAPAGLLPGLTYQVTASHGFEYDRATAEATADQAAVQMTLQQVLPRPAGWYCGDSHTHSIYSDGSDTPTQMAHTSLAEGLNWQVATDHGQGTSLPAIEALHAEIAPFAEAGPDAFIVIPGQEYSLRDYHANVLGGRFLYPVDQPLQAMLDAAYGSSTPEQPVVAVLNHPTWDGTPKAPELARALERLPMLELWNGPEPGGINLWWELLNKGLRTIAITNTDAHSRRGVGSRRTYVWLGDQPLTRSAVIGALRAGHSYLSRGAVLDVTFGGRRPGEEVPAGPVVIDLKIFSAQPIDRAELVVNGQVVKTVAGGGQDRLELRETVDVPAGWCLVQVMQANNPTPLAMTNPVFVKAN